MRVCLEEILDAVEAGACRTLLLVVRRLYRVRVGCILLPFLSLVWNDKLSLRLLPGLEKRAVPVKMPPQPTADRSSAGSRSK